MKQLLLVVIALSLCGCTVGPNYKRPAIAAPPEFRGAPPASGNPSTFAELAWSDVFTDDQLRMLIRAALDNNYDLRLAVLRVDSARAVLGITRSNQYPNLAAAGAIDFNRLSRDATTRLPATVLPNQDRTFGAASINVPFYELDLWGKLRRATEAARADVLAADENRKTVAIALVSQVVTSYFSLRELDAELEISQQTLKVRRDSLELVKTRQEGGVATLLDLRQAEQLVDTAAQAVPALQLQIERTENGINLLLAKNPDSVPRGRSLVEQSLPEIPPGLPSSLLERRPDIRAAEQSLIAANARIGVAKAAYFPDVSLTGIIGGQSTQLAALFAGPHRAWSFVPQVTQPIFTAGRLKGNVRLAEAQRESALVQYQKTIQTAFAEVSDALIAHQRTRESRQQQEALVQALTDRKRLAYIRYRGGVDTELNALDADRDLFQAQLALSSIRLNELLTVVQLFQSLGGGWK